MISLQCESRYIIEGKKSQETEKLGENALRQGYMDGDVQQGTTIFYQVH